MSKSEGSFLHNNYFAQFIPEVSLSFSLIELVPSHGLFDSDYQNMVLVPCSQYSLHIFSLAQVFQDTVPQSQQNRNGLARAWVDSQYTHTHTHTHTHIYIYILIRDTVTVNYYIYIYIYIY